MSDSSWYWTWHNADGHINAFYREVSHGQHRIQFRFLSCCVDFIFSRIKCSIEATRRFKGWRCSYQQSANEKHQTRGYTDLLQLNLVNYIVHGMSWFTDITCEQNMHWIMIANSTYNNCREYHTNSNYKTNHTYISTNSFTVYTLFLYTLGNMPMSIHIYTHKKTHK